MNGRVEAFDEDDIDFSALFRKLLAGRWWILASVAVSMAIFIAVALRTTPVYRAAVVVTSATRQASGALSGLGQLAGLTAGVGINLGARDPQTEEVLAVLRSRRFSETFIESKNLLPRLFPSQWDDAKKAWKVPMAEQPTLAKAYKIFDQQVRSISEDTKTGLITVRVDWTDRDEAAAWANELVARVNQEMRLRAISEADASIQFLEKELQQTATVQTREAISRLIGDQVKQRMLANVTPAYSFRVVDQAIAPDADDPVRPNKLLLFMLGPVVGLIAGFFIVLLSGAGKVPERS